MWWHDGLLIGQTYPKHISQTRFPQEKLRLAAKSALNRMMAVKRKRVGLNVDAWVREEWQKRDKGEMAQLLMDANFDKAW